MHRNVDICCGFPACGFRLAVSVLFATRAARDYQCWRSMDKCRACGPHAELNSKQLIYLHHVPQLSCRQQNVGNEAKVRVSGAIRACRAATCKVGQWVQLTSQFHTLKLYTLVIRLHLHLAWSAATVHQICQAFQKQNPEWIAHVTGLNQLPYN